MDETSPISEPPSAAAPSATSLVGKMINVIAAPQDVFDEVKAAPYSAANWLLPATLFIVVSWLSGWLIFSQASIQQQMKDFSTQAIDKQVEKGALSGEKAEQARAMAEKVGSVGYKVGAAVFPVFMAFAVPFWWGLILWLGGTKVLHGTFSYMKAVEVAGLASTILVLDAVVRTLLVLVTGNFFASPSLALLLKDADPQSIPFALSGMVNIMIIWVLYARSVGLARLTGSSFGRAAGWVFGIWLGYTGILIGLGAAAQAVFKR